MTRLGFVLLAPLLAAQAPFGADEVRSTNRVYQLPSPVTLSVQTNLVEVGVVIRDARGHVVGGLQRNDFRIFDNGKERPITAFSVETAAPRVSTNDRATVPDNAAPPATAKPAAAQRSVVLFFDDFSIGIGDLARTKLAASRFVKQALDPGDRVAIMTSSSAQFLDFTSDTAKVLDMIPRLSSHVRVNPNGIVPCPRITPYEAYLISNNDSGVLKAAVDEEYICEYGPPLPTPIDPKEVNQMKPRVISQAEATWQQARLSSQDTLIAINAALDRVSKAPGTRMLVLASSGFLAMTLEADQDRIVDRALRANVVIHALDAKGLYTDDPRSGGASGGDVPLGMFVFEQTTAAGRVLETNAAMANLAESTGGLFLHNSNDLDASLRNLVPETTYRLGFAPTGVADDGKYHALKVRLSNPGSNRGGSNHVLARRGYFTPPPVKPPAPLRDIDRAAAAADTVSDLPVRVVPEPGQQTLAVTLVVDVRQLNFGAQDARHVQKLSFVAALFSERGDFISGKEGELNLALKQATYEHFAETGISTRVTLQAPPGSYRLRTVVADSAGKITASTQPVEIH